MNNAATILAKLRMIFPPIHNDNAAGRCRRRTRQWHARCSFCDGSVATEKREPTWEEAFLNAQANARRALTRVTPHVTSVRATAAIQEAISLAVRDSRTIAMH